MCNSYNNGHCLYYGVEVRELNYKCERGVCMEHIDILEAMRATAKHINEQKPDHYKRKVLIGGPAQIEMWKKMYGDSVDYIENAMIKR